MDQLFCISFFIILMLICFRTELAIQPSLNASLMPRYSTQNDATNASDKAAAAGSSSNAPQSPGGE